MSSSGARKLRICVLQCSYEQTDSCFKELDPYCTPEVYDTEGKYEWSHAYIRKATAVRQVRELALSGTVDVFLNLCDGVFDEDRAGCEVVDALERYGCAYTGADRVFYEPSKALQKKLAYYYDVPTAPWAVMMSVDLQDDARATSQCAEAVAGLHYPLIVKHYNGGGSIGMGRDCKVEDLPALVAQVRKFVREFGGALVEEFIEGREFTVLVVENAQDAQQPSALTPVECIFGAGETFKHFDLKWRDYETMRWQPVDEQAEPELCAALKRHASAAFVALHGTSYGRADFRVDLQGKVRFLEHNPNCGIFYPPDAMGSADYILTLDPTINHMAFIDHIVAAAQARQAARQDAQRVEVVYRHLQGFGLIATRDLQPGQVIVKFEETPHVLVSASHIRRIFGQDALPAANSTAMSSAVPDHTGSTVTDDGVSTPAQQGVQAGGVAEQPELPAPAPLPVSQGAEAAATVGITCTVNNSSSNDSNSGDGINDSNDNNGSSDNSSGGGSNSAGAGHARTGSVDSGSGSRLHDDGSAASSLSPCPSDASLTLTLAAATAAAATAAKAGAAVDAAADTAQPTAAAGTGESSPAQAAAAQPAAGPGGDAPAAAGGSAGGGCVPARSSRYLEWFRAYAYPITDETWVTWSEDPEQWLPLNHCCDPNAWLAGLDLVARRPIKKGEQITAEYATFTAHNMAPFHCSCGAACCRGLVQGTDYLQPWVQTVYGGHLSDYVASKRRQLLQRRQH